MFFQTVENSNEVVVASVDVSRLEEGKADISLVDARGICSRIALLLRSPSMSVPFPCRFRADTAPAQNRLH
jgi:hypothetical protein